MQKRKLWLGDSRGLFQDVGLIIFTWVSVAPQAAEQIQGNLSLNSKHILMHIAWVPAKLIFFMSPIITF